MDDEYVKKLVIARLMTIPPNVGFSLGSFGSFSRDEIIDNVQRGTEVGKEFTKIELKMLLGSPKLVGRLSGKTASSY
ncbi:MAG: hypothetical protein ABIH83_00955 [Candidatus Micrarchaeota archaeon]